MSVFNGSPMRSVQSGGNAASVVLIGLTQDEVGRVRELLVGEAAFPSDPVGFGEAAYAAIQRSKPNIALISFTQGSEAPLAIGQALSRDFPNLTLIALSSGTSADLVMSAMRVGFKDFVVLPQDSQRLREVVKNTSFSAPADDDAGTLVAVVGAKGGVGSTILSVHIAAELAAMQRVLAIDLDMSMGDLAPVFNLKTTEDVTTVLERVDRLDERSLQSSAVVHRSKAHILGQPADGAYGVQYTGDDIYTILSVAAQAYQFVVVDCGAAMDEATLMAVQVSDTILLVTEPTVISVRDAFRKLQALLSYGVERDRIRLVLNRYHPSSYVSVEAIEKNLGVKVTCTLADDPGTMGAAYNEGRLVREVNKKAALANDIATLVAVAADDEAPTQTTSSSGGFWGGLFGRS